MSILKVARMGHPVLRERARPVDTSELKDPLFQKLIDDMVETMHEYHGVGLAAPQVHEGVRLFVAVLDDDPDSESDATVIINPDIIPNAPDKRDGWEGCLSIPDIRGMVPRFTDITVLALDRHGNKIELKLAQAIGRDANIGKFAKAGADTVNHGVACDDIFDDLARSKNARPG